MLFLREWGADEEASVEGILIARSELAQMNRWTYQIEEVSPSVYEVLAVRDTHHSIEKKGFENVISEILAESLDLEISLGTPPGEALFHVTRGFKNFWSARFDEKVFGSWVVFNPRTTSAVECDGKDSWVVMKRSSDSSWKDSHWNGRLPDIFRGESEYFRKLLYFY